MATRDYTPEERPLHVVPDMRLEAEATQEVSLTPYASQPSPGTERMRRPVDAHYHLPAVDDSRHPMFG